MAGGALCALDMSAWRGRCAIRGPLNIIYLRDPYLP